MHIVPLFCIFFNSFFCVVWFGFIGLSDLLILISLSICDDTYICMYTLYYIYCIYHIMHTNRWAGNFSASLFPSLCLSYTLIHLCQHV